MQNEHGKIAYQTYRKEILSRYEKKLPKWDKLDPKHKEIWSEVWFAVGDNWAHSVFFDKKQIDDIIKKERKR